MDPRLLNYYERELRHVREMGSEFAREFPKIAGRLGFTPGQPCADPYVERLLEGFAFMAARVQMRLDAEFPRFTQHLLELIYPQYLAPTPSMTVVQLQPKQRMAALPDGFVVPRESVLRSRLGPGQQTSCEYRTKHEVTLWPLRIERADYGSSLAELGDLPVLHGAEPVRAYLRLQLRATAGQRFDQLRLDTLPLFVSGNDATALKLYEELLASPQAVLVRPRRPGARWLHAGGVRSLGFEDRDALLPYGPRSFHGYRLLHEYFAFPSRFMFVELFDLGAALAQCACDDLELVVLLGREQAALEGVIEADRLQPFCTPAINVFPRQLDRIHVGSRSAEYHVVPDRTRPLDLEVHSIEKVTGLGSGMDSEREFARLYATPAGFLDQPSAYYTLERRPRLRAGKRNDGIVSSYAGSELFLSLVDGSPQTDLRQLAVSALCTNRDLPLQLVPGAIDFSLQSGAPVEAVRCLAGPSAPRPSRAEGELAWRLISHLSLNYLSIADGGAARAGGAPAARALRELLALYAELGDAPARKQIAGVRSVASRQVTRALPGAGPLCFGRGLEVTLECDEAAFQGGSAFLLGAVLERFFAKYVSINSFTETALRSAQRGEIMRWPTTLGQRHLA